MSESIHVVCPHCNVLVRVPVSRSGDRPRCSRCHEPLFSGHTVDLDTVSFDVHLSRNDIPVLVDFWAPWCGPCKVMAPALQQATVELEPKIRVAKVNTEEEQGLGARFSIRSIPTLVLFIKGREVARQSGAMAKPDIIRWTLAQLADVK